MTDTVLPPEPAPSDIAAISGSLLLEFGAAWCGYCRAAQPLIGQALAGKSHIRHLRIEDGKGRRLGRHFRVKLWPTLVLLADGEEVGRLVRPQDVEAITALLSMTRPD